MVSVQLILSGLCTVFHMWYHFYSVADSTEKEWSSSETKQHVLIGTTSVGRFWKCHLFGGGHSKRGLASEAVTRVLEQLEQNSHVQWTPHEISVKLVYRQSPWTCTISAWKCTPLNQSQLFLKEKLSCDWLRGVHFHAKIVHVQELLRYCMF